MSWGLISAKDQLALVFSYDDAKRGRSAKGSLMRSTEPTRDDARAACERPNLTVRIEGPVRALPLTADELIALELPDEPPWLERFVTDAPPAVEREKPEEPEPLSPLVWLAAAVFVLGAAVVVFLLVDAL